MKSGAPRPVLIALVSVVLLLIASLASNYNQRKLYQNAVLASTMQAWQTNQRASHLIKNGDERDIERAISQIDQTLSILRDFRMTDKKSATFVFDVEAMHPEVIESLSFENKAYIKEIGEKWNGETLGFPDKW
jgi:hypothetical protein